MGMEVKIRDEGKIQVFLLQSEISGEISMKFIQNDEFLSILLKTLVSCDFS